MLSSMVVDEKVLLSTPKPGYGHRHRRSQAVSLDLKRDIAQSTTPMVKKDLCNDDDTKTQSQQGKVKFSPVVETIPRFQKEEVDSKHRRRRSLSSFFNTIQFRKSAVHSVTPSPRRAPEPLFDLDVVERNPTGHKRAGSCPELVPGSSHGYFSKKRKMEPVTEESHIAPSIAARSSTSTVCTYVEREPLPSPFSECLEDWHDRITIYEDMDLVHRATIDIGEPGPECPNTPSPLEKKSSSRWNKYRFWKK